jgi:hypothetical protein
MPTDQPSLLMLPCEPYLHCCSQEISWLYTIKDLFSVIDHENGWNAFSESGLRAHFRGL